MKSTFLIITHKVTPIVSYAEFNNEFEMHWHEVYSFVVSMIALAPAMNFEITICQLSVH
jgi:hypothetical protein